MAYTVTYIWEDETRTVSYTDSHTVLARPGYDSTDYYDYLNDPDGTINIYSGQVISGRDCELHELSSRVAPGEEEIYRCYIYFDAPGCSNIPNSEIIDLPADGSEYWYYLPNTIPIHPDGYEFVGWRDVNREDASGYGYLYEYNNGFDEYINLSINGQSEIHLEAEWIEPDNPEPDDNVFAQVYFDTRGGTELPTELIYGHAQSLSLPTTAEVTKDGCELYRWFDDYEYVSYEPGDSVHITIDSTFTAYYKLKFTFDLDGGYAIAEHDDGDDIVYALDPLEVREPHGYEGEFGDRDIFLPAYSIRKPGYTFKYWQAVENPSIVLTPGAALAENGVMLDGITRGYTLKAVFEPEPIKIKSQPKSASVMAGSVVKFSVDAEGYDLVFKWQCSKNGVTWLDTTTAGYNTNTLLVDTTEAMNGYQYRCIIASHGGHAHGTQITSSTVILTVIKSAVRIKTASGWRVGTVLYKTANGWVKGKLISKTKNGWR